MIAGGGGGAGQNGSGGGGGGNGGGGPATGDFYGQSSPGSGPGGSIVLMIEMVEKMTLGIMVLD